MKKQISLVIAWGAVAGIAWAAASVFNDYKTLSPGTWHHITVADLPQPYATKSAGNGPKVVDRPAGAMPQVIPGFHVEQYVSGLDGPREMRTAPNGDVFIAESSAGTLEVLRVVGGKPQVQVFTDGLKQPFGIAFYPPGPNPQYVYVGNTNSVWRYPYKNGDLKATGPDEVMVESLPAFRSHWTRDLAFSPDGKRMFVSVGSGSNVDDPDTHPAEFHRANILEFTPAGKFVKVYASGIRNPVGDYDSTGDGRFVVFDE
jgi:glucose/arabinose dehydrogenase